VQQWRLVLGQFSLRDVTLRYCFTTSWQHRQPRSTKDGRVQTKYLRMFWWLWWLHVRVVLFPLPGLPEWRGVGQERISLLSSGLLHALHTGTAPQTGGQGEMGHWGLYWWRRGERLLLYPLCQLPDFLGDQGEGGKIDLDVWTRSVSMIKMGSWGNNVNIYPHNFAQHLHFCIKHLQLNVWGGAKTPIMGQIKEKCL